MDKWKDWQKVSTGGHCYSYCKVMPDKTYFLATDQEGINLPVKFDEILVGHYYENGEPSQLVQLMSFNALEEMIAYYMSLNPEENYDE